MKTTTKRIKLFMTTLLAFISITVLLSYTAFAASVTFNVNVQSIHDLYVNTVTPVKEDYALLNAKVSYRFGSQSKGLNLFVKGENLTATRYTINEGFPMPKAIVMGGFDVTF